jgi:hypothetical protein
MTYASKLIERFLVGITEYAVIADSNDVSRVPIWALTSLARVGTMAARLRATVYQVREELAQLKQRNL